MFEKSTVKKRESSKTSFNYLKNEEDEVRAELEAMTGLEYNLHSEKAAESTELAPAFGKKVKSSLKSQSKLEKIMDYDKSSGREKIEIESQIPFYSSTASAKELQGIINQQGCNSEDRYKILDARDRLMRLKQVKSHTLETAKVTRGTCPDMCPEKERLMREFQRQVASYELAESGEYKICHETAVKQYSRSSADQEEPMPQDLRPVNSLKMTMSYLLHEICDLCEEEGTNLAEWYHFLWDRTRGIRKDITQQELCCLETVELVEQCARFHIVCSERLCAEESSVFDKKINTENLTKCLQTLKYMYHDLRIQGVACKNESEFRAYIILLNLNNENFMWDLQRLPKIIQSSTEVKFAIQVFLSIQSNNYAKFFKLVRETTYLNSCILLRYFFQVRVSALSVMVKAYCRTASTAYPLYEFIDILGFDDENEAISFCEQAGLNVSNDELHIVLNRQNIILPPPVMDEGRAVSLVEAKRTKMGYSIGQTIAGGNMPEQLYLNHTPHNSFNPQGYLKSEAINASDQNSGLINEEPDPYEYLEVDADEPLPPLRRGAMAVELGDEDEEEEEGEEERKEGIDDDEDEEEEENEEISVKPFVFSSMHSKSKARISTKNFKFRRNKHQDFRTSIDSSLISKSKEKFSSSNKQGFSFSQVKSNVFAKPGIGSESHIPTSIAPNQSIFSSGAQKNIFSKSVRSNDTSSVAATSESSLKIGKSTQQLSPMKKRRDEDIVEEKKRADELKLKEEKEKMKMKLMAQEKISEKIDRDARECADEIELFVLHDMCSTILKEEIERLKVFERISEKVRDDIIKEFIYENCKKALDEELYIEKRLREVSKRMKNRIVFKYYRIWQQNAMKKRKQRRALDNTPVWLPKYSLDACADSLYRKDQELVIQSMSRKRFKRDNEDMDLKYLCPIELKIYSGLKENAKTLDTDPTLIIFWKMVVSWPHLENRVLLWRYKNIMNQYLCPGDVFMDPIIKIYKPNPYETLNICIKHCEGISKEDHVVGMDGLFFIATSDEDPKMIAKRLTKTVLSRQKLIPIPLVLIILGNDADAERIEPTSELEYLSQAEYISEYTVHYEKIMDEETILKLTQTAILWLALNKSTPIPLEMNYLKDVVDNCLMDELWLRISGHATFNSPLRSAVGDAKFIIALHNEAVNRLMDIILDPESLLYTDFPPEFRALLPKDFEVPCSYEYFDANWKKEENREKIENTIASFILPPWPFDWPINDVLELQRCIIRYCHSTLRLSNYNTIACNILSNIFFMPRGNEMPNFVDVLLEIMKEKVNSIDSELTAVYDKNHIKSFRTLPWWFKSNALVQYESQLSQLVEDTHEEPAVKRRRLEEEEEREHQDLSMIIEEYDSICDVDDRAAVKLLFNKSRSNLSDIQKTSDKLERAMEEQRMASKKFEEKLQAALNDERAFND